MFTFTQLKKSTTRFTLVAVTVGTLAACSAVYRNHGYTPTPDELNEIKVGVDTRDSVIEAVGAPSSGGVLDESGLYYVATRMRHYGPRAPQIVSRELVAISFNQSGTVKNVERFGLEDGRVIALQRRVTTSSVESSTFLRQLLGNLGNFNPAAALGQ